MRARPATPKLALIAAAIALASPASSWGQHVGIGRALFTFECSRCHGLPPAVLLGADAAAGDPSLISAAMGRVRPMTQLRGRITEQDMRDIAAFLATPDAPGSRPADEIERLFNWAEWRFQTLLKPRSPTFSLQGFTVRYYATPGLYVGMADGKVWLYENARADMGIQLLGTMPAYLGMAAADGF